MLKPFKEFGGFSDHESPIFLARPCNKPFSASNSNVLVLVAHCGLVKHESVFGNRFFGASLVAQMVKNLPSMRETPVQSLGWEDPPGEGCDKPL